MKDIFKSLKIDNSQKIINNFFNEVKSSINIKGLVGSGLTFRLNDGAYATINGRWLKVAGDTDITLSGDNTHYIYLQISDDGGSEVVSGEGEADDRCLEEFWSGGRRRKVE